MDGLDDVLANLARTASLIVDSGVDGLKTVAGQARDLAADQVDVDTGRLRDSLRGGPGGLAGATDGIRFGHDRRGEFAEIGTSVFYGRFRERGTVKAAAHAFIRPAVYRVRRDGAAQIADKIRVRLRTGFRRKPRRRVASTDL